MVPTIKKGLASGDYSIEGFEDQVAIERKSLDDLHGSVTWGRDRFERETARLDGEITSFAAVVIEATWLEIVSPAEYRPGWENQTDPRSVEGTIVAWSLRYPGVHWWACGDRRGAECRTFSILRKFWQENAGSGKQQ
jgi:ERCC4-type nuclease